MRRLPMAVFAAALFAGCARPPGIPVPIVEVPGDRREAFAAAIQLVKTERYAEAAIRFQSLETTYPELEDYHLYYRGLALARGGHAADAVAPLQGILADHPRSVQRGPAALELGRVQGHLGRLGAAGEALRIARESPDRAVAVPAELELARVDLSAGDVVDAARLLQHVRRAAPREQAGMEARVELLRLRASHPEIAPGGPGLIEEARVLLAEQDAGAAESLTAGALAQASGEDRRALLDVHASALLALGRVDDALDDLRALARSESDAAATQFRIASILWNRDRDAEALPAFVELQHRFPHAPQAAAAMYAIGRIHEKAGRTTQAIAAYRQLEGSPDPLAPEAQWRIGWIHYVDGHWQAAAQDFGALAQCGSAATCSDGLYWQARALEHQGDAAAARERYRRIVTEAPASYYAMWAERRLGLAAPAAAQVALPPPPPAPAPAEDYHLHRAVELQLARLAPLARVELTAYEREHAGDPAQLRGLLQWYRAVDGDGAALRLAQRLGERARLSSSERERIMYPLGFWPLIDAAARGAALDPLLVAAVIRQESLYDPDARSPADAYGLMQLLPGTAQRVAGAPVPIEELRDPQRNITLGTAYLAGLFSRFGGDELKALAAYNGGETAVEKWQRRFAGGEGDEFVESISYRETRDYVKKVIGGYRRYRQIYGTPSGQ